MHDARYRIQDAGCRMHDARYKMQDFACGNGSAECGIIKLKLGREPES